MSDLKNFTDTIRKGYTFEGDQVVIGGAMYEQTSVPDSLVRVPLKTVNRHGLIAGATGTGKTKSLQVLSEALSWKGVPCLLMDIKGDLSGLAEPSPGHPKIDERHERIGIPHHPNGFPIEFLSLSDEPGVRLRATVLEFGPILFSKILGLNDIQTGIVALVFKYADDNKLPLLDLKDFRKVLLYVSDEGKEEVEKHYGTMSPASVGAIMRKMVELEQQGAERFFGERSFEVGDLMRTDTDGRGVISILRVTDLQDRPKLFSTFMLSLLAEVYGSFPEVGDPDKPKLAIFVDEAHLIFEEASDVLLDQIETIIKLVRSKGVGVFFVTQNPADIPDDILGQLGLKIQHALRAFTAKDRRKLKLAAENYPISAFYDTADLLTKMGIGEAAVTVLNEKGIPTPLVHTLLCAPQSRMDVLTKQEIDRVVARSELIDYYNEAIDRESAHEMLTEKIERAQEKEKQAEYRRDQEEVRQTSRRRGREKSALEKVLGSSAARQVGRTLARELTRGILGALGVNTRRRSYRRRR